MNGYKTMQILEGTYLYANGEQTVLCPYDVQDVKPGEKVELVNALGEVCCVAEVVGLVRKMFANMTTQECHTISHQGFSSWGSAYETQRTLDPTFSQLSPVTIAKVIPTAYIIPGVTYSVAAPVAEREPVEEVPEVTDEAMESLIASLGEVGANAE